MTHPRNDGNMVDKDEARTPPSLFKKLDDRFHFHLDVCATQDNALCQAYFTKEGNCLAIDTWIDDDYDDDDYLIADGINTFFCNPPYSNPEPFICKAYEESLKGATVVMLLPADTSTKVFHYYTMKASEIIFIEGRVRFNNPDGTPMKGSPKFGSMVVVFKQEEFDGSPVISSMGWR